MRFAARRADLCQPMNKLGFTRPAHAMTYWDGPRLELSWSVATRPGSESDTGCTLKDGRKRRSSHLIGGAERLLASDARDPNLIAVAVGASDATTSAAGTSAR